MPEPVNIEITLRADSAPESPDSTPGYSAEMRLTIPERDAADTITADVRIDFDALDGYALNPLEYGRALGRMLFADPALQRGLTEGREAAEAAHDGPAELRLRLRIDSSAKELHAVHWEKLVDPATGSPLTTTERVLFSRLLPGRPLALRPRTGGKGGKASLRVLAVSANPAGLEADGWGAVDVEGELERARRGLAGIQLDTLPLTWAEDEQGWVDDPQGRRASFDDLAGLLRGGPDSKPDFPGYDALYIATHGRLLPSGPQIALEDARGDLAWVGGAELAELLGSLPRPPRLVVLAACDSAGTGEAGEDGKPRLDPLMAAGPLLVAEGIPAVIAMQGRVPMSTVEQFTQVFFKELARDGVIDRAMAAARLKLKKRAWWGVPVLFLRLLTGRLWSEETDAEPRPAEREQVPHQIAPPGERFIGRAEELARLRLAVEEEGCAVIGISGMGGMGKTSIALKLVEQIAGGYPDGQVYFDLGETGVRPAGATQALGHILHSFQPQAQQPENLEQLQAAVRSLLYDRRVLVLIDNARSEEQVRPLAPLPKGCLLIVTSWRRLDLDGIFDLPLGELSDADARAMLLDIAPDVKELALPLAQAAGKLPQAIQVLASLLRRRPDLTPSDLLRRMREDPDRLQFSGMESLLEVSYNLLAERLRRPWKQLAVFAGDFDAHSAAWLWGFINKDTTGEQVEAAVDKARDTLGELLEHSLLHYDRATRRYSMYQIAKIYAIRKSEAGGEAGRAERQAALRAHASCFLRVLIRANELFLAGGDRLLEGLALFDRERREITAGQAWTAAASAAAAAAPSGETIDRERLGLCSLYAGFGGYCLALRFTPREQITWLEAGLKAAQALGDRRMEGIHHGNLGSAVQEVHGPKPAMAYFKEQLRIGRAVKDYASQINAYNSLGIAYWKQGRPKPAIQEYQKAVRLARRRKDRAGEARALGNLGLAYRDLGQTQNAITHYEGQLAIARELGDLQQESIALNNLGVEYTGQGLLERAFETFHHALEIYKKLDDRAGYGRALDSLGSAFRKRGDLEQARAYFEEALRYQREAFDRQGEALTCWNLGELLEQQGDVEAAIKLMQQSVDYETEIGHAEAAARAKRLAGLRRKWKKPSG